jgi:hypothetical protein
METQPRIGREKGENEYVGSRSKPMRTGHKQGEMQLIAFTCRPR